MNIALVGNQNCGKTTLFNALTGSNQKVGNWAGVTVEKKTGIIKGTSHNLIDLPGIYSLTPYTAEEEISRNYILKEKPDLIINLIDASYLERSLYLTTQLIEQDCNILLVLNMCENLKKKGQVIDAKVLSSKLNLPCIKVNAVTGENLKNLIKLINKNISSKTSLSVYPSNIESLISKITNSSTPKITKFCATEILENFNNNLEKKYNYDNLQKEILSIESSYNLEMCHLIPFFRYENIKNILKDCVLTSTSAPPKESVTKKLDKIFLNKFLAIPIFIVIMGLIYFLSVGVVGKYTSSLISNGFLEFSDWVKNGLKSLNANEIIISLICDGIIAGVGSVLNFVPQLIILFICICLLETTGYMSRISFILDNFFYKLGISGKSLIPFIVGTGCSVPAIMSTRTIESDSEKQTTVILTPFIPCSAKLPIISLFAGYFFSRSYIVTILIYLFSVILIILCAFIFNKFIFKKVNTTLIFELPEYKKPSFKYVFKDTTQKTWAFIKRAGSTILICSIIVWFLVSFNWKFKYGVDIKDSILASIGNLFGWIFYPFLQTYSWGATVSALQGFIAKEQVISSMSIIAGVEGASGNLIFSVGSVFAFFTPVTALAYLVFNLFSAPCFSAIIAMKKELGSTKKTIFAVLFQIVIALILANLVTLFGNLIVGI